jgi:RNA polymerase sigma-70 factor (ECF subfamily)
LVNKGLMTEIFLACRVQLARVVSRIVPPQEIEDIVQETYVRVCQYNSRNDIGEPKALMLSVARNLALDHVKRAEYRLTSAYANEADLESALARHAEDESYRTVASNEEFSRFCDAVRQLPVQCRRVFVLKKVYGLSQRQIAAELGIAESTVEKHIANGMLHCARYLNAGERPGRRRAKGQGSMATIRGRS